MKNEQMTVDTKKRVFEEPAVAVITLQTQDILTKSFGSFLEIALDEEGEGDRLPW